MILFGRKNKYLKTQGKPGFRESFNHATDGLDYAINHERNLKIEIFIGILVCIAGFIFKISLLEWLVIVLVIAMVISLELVNTSIERAVDLVTKEYKDLAKVAKDVAAGAVLIMSMFSVVVGIIIFLPKIIEFVNR